MRINGQGVAGIGNVTPATDAPAAGPATGSTTAPAPALQSAVLQPAMAALAGMPEIDQARVDALREALARGEVPFDPDKLAGLIERFHGKQG
ncbi:flagellar biosynthesis anti-sigma factor FlgM [Methyloversatilis thermotolerans]|uniref:flagellar biosynthesis anti-sigma factor FlgM n=1 Tax=Methyloversatilis thermotolerans TaxID=1346290 RepID=UPI00036CF592|nr:flagellar biosynthesis anti-sigma factor FlgM [Methyloversatilis thermotolerans]